MGRPDKMIRKQGKTIRKQDELIRKSDAIKAINLIQNVLFNSDILPVTPQTRERHDIIQGILRHVWKVKEKLEKLPAVQPESSWITCDKLPDYGYQVLISTYDWVTVAHRISLMYGNEKEKDNWIDYDGQLIKPEDVYAWMPFPDPYEGGGG